MQGIFRKENTDKALKYGIYRHLPTYEKIIRNLVSFWNKLLHLFYCSCKFHCFCDGNKRIAITLTAMFLLKNGYMAVANTYFREMENISYHVAAGHIDEELLRRILAAILTCTYDSDEELKLDIFNAISAEDVFY
jgi:death-on-curing protein